MLLTSLFLSVLLLTVANVAVAKTRYGAAWVVFAGMSCTFLPCLMFVFYFAVGIQSLLLALLLMVLLFPRRGRQVYLVASILATLLAYVPFIAQGLKQEHGMQKLRDSLPLESLEERIPARSGIPSAPKYNLRLDTLETRIEHETAFGSRSSSLKALHETSVRKFAETAGVGVGRMPREPRTDEEFLHPRDAGPVPQPDYLNPPAPPAGPLRDNVPEWPGDRMTTMHESAVFDFLNLKGFGYVKSRRAVAGFQSHRMSESPVSPAPWKTDRVELVGLLVHEGPVAYPSESLPRMSESRNAPTRPLDAFESEGLEELKNGEDVFVRGAEEHARMLGAIRATKQCLECHGGNRGDLLGAFSYGFRRDAIAGKK